MNKMQKAFADVGIVAPKREYDNQFCLDRASTGGAIERHNDVHWNFGRMILQFNRPEFRKEVLPMMSKAQKPIPAAKLTPREKRWAKDEDRRKRAVAKAIKTKPKVPAVVLPTVCGVAKKKIYTIKGARRALSAALASKYNYTPKRMYLCDHCKMYHLTSKL